MQIKIILGILKDIIRYTVVSIGTKYATDLVEKVSCKKKTESK